MPLGIEPTPDIIIAHDVYALPAGRRAARMLDIPLVYDSHENWPFLIAEHSKTEAVLADWIEKHGHRPDHVFTVGESIAGRFRRMGLPTDVLYNARASKDIVLMERDKARNVFGLPDDAFVLGYIGKIGLLIDTGIFKPIFEAIAGTPNVELFIVGGPDDAAETLKEYVKATGLDTKVRVVGQKPFIELPAFYGALDAGLIVLDERPNHMVALPNKLFDYMGFGVPVIAPDYPDISAIVRKYDCGILLAGWEYPKTRTDCLRDVLAVAKERQTKLEEMGHNGRGAFLEHYAWEKQAPRFVRIVNNLVQT
jgi:glycosyltransferase involved in cell wall biosynthesis